MFRDGNYINRPFFLFFEMEVLTKTELGLRLEEILGKIANGAVFIYPTDTI